jgi:HAD superfamily hydrolase (TIGR01509 family)
LSLPAAVLWDMDGTLVDTEPYWIECEHELVAEHGDGSWTTAKGHLLVGHDLRDSAMLLQQHGAVTLPVDDIVDYLLDGVIQRVRTRIPWRPGARELLADLAAHQVPSALVTMSYRRFVDAVIPALPAGSFAATITGDEVTYGKPHPEPYLTAAAALGHTASACVAIEDSPTGVRSAVAAGCRVIAVPNVVALPDDPAYRLVGSLSGLTAHTLWP